MSVHVPTCICTQEFVSDTYTCIYLIIVCTTALQVKNEKRFEIKGRKDQDLAWEDYGFTISISKGSLQDQEAASIIVQYIENELFELPEGYQRISGIFLVRYYASKIITMGEAEVYV